ncbi:probable serine/threonine-protein kinase pats1 [Mytilus trossulus]|uniref:probable serine/threonine-protein kinase pats1 n=1 Tax=Mytilus trossulus TaxID=6551 RepID=UPI003005F5B9
MPLVIKEMSVHDRDMFLKAASTGTAVRYYVRVMIVGESGVGKTCLLRRLMKKDINGVNSTNGINIEVRKCKIDLKKKEWISDSDDEFSSISPYQSQQYADCGFWDFAGQKDFYATHQTFLSTNAIYLLVADISKDLTNKTFKDMVENEFDTSGEYIDFWLDNIHSYAVNDENIASETDTWNPPVIIIGTKVDKLQNEEQKLEKKKGIIELLQHNTNFNHIRGSPYFLSNKEAWNYDSKLKELREKILEVAMNIPKWEDNLPTRWIVLEREIGNQIAKEIYIISYEEAQKLAENCSFPFSKTDSKMSANSKTDSELDSFLKYEHEIGNLIFFESIKRYIILEPKWLVTVFKCFVSATEFQSDYVDMKEWSQLESTGILSDSLITKLFEKEVKLHSPEQRKFALQVMETFNIIVKHTNKDETAISDDNDDKEENLAADDTIELGDDGPEPDEEPEKKNTSRQQLLINWQVCLTIIGEENKQQRKQKTKAREEIEQKKEEMKDKIYKEKVDLLRAMVEALQNKN